MWREKLEAECRAKILWGDSPEDVQAYMRSQGFTEQEAREAVMAMVQDKIVRGIVMQVAPGSISGDLSDPSET